MQEQVTESGPVVVEATDQNFLETVIEESKKRPVVVDLWASWCGPCRTLGPILEKVAGERAGSFLLAKLDVDANPYTAGQFGVQSIPTVVAFRDGQPVDGFVGAIPEPMSIMSFNLIGGQKSLSGTATGSPAVVRKMVEFCARHNIETVTENYPMSKINDAFEHLESGKARYRIVLEADF